MTAVRPAYVLILIVATAVGVALITKIPSFAQRGAGTVAPCSDCNMVLIIADTLGAKHLGLYGYERDTSPFIDEFFGAGIVFEHAYATAPWTLPSVPPMFYGRLASDITHGELYPENPFGLTHVLRESGITVRNKPVRDDILEFEDGRPHNYVFKRVLASPFTNAEINTASATTTLRGLAETWKETGQRFFFALHDATVHDPYDPADAYQDLFEENDAPEVVLLEDIRRAGDEAPIDTETLAAYELRYDQEIRELDDLIRELVNTLPSDVKEKTIFVLVSDHGEAFGEHGLVWHGNSTYNTLLHVPLLVAYPGMTEPARISERISLLDLAPTIAYLLDLPPRSEWTGRNLFDPEHSRDRTVISIGGRPRIFDEAETVEDVVRLWSEYTDLPYLTTGQRSIIKGDLKVITSHPQSSTTSFVEVYDLATDPEELNNLLAPMHAE